MRRGFFTLLLVCAAAITAVAAAQANTSDWLLYNATPSVPRGWYMRSRNDIVIGAMVTVRAAVVAPGYAASRDFTDAGDRFIKRVAAMAGTRVCAHAETVTVLARLRAPDRSPEVENALKTRAQELKRLGLAHEVERNIFEFEPGWRDALKAMELHLDIRKSLMRTRMREMQRSLERARDVSRSLRLGLDR